MLYIPSCFYIGAHQHVHKSDAAPRAPYPHCSCCTVAATEVQSFACGSGSSEETNLSDLVQETARALARAVVTTRVACSSSGGADTEACGFAQGDVEVIARAQASAPPPPPPESTVRVGAHTVPAGSPAWVPRCVQTVHSCSLTDVFPRVVHLYFHVASTIGVGAA